MVASWSSAGTWPAGAVGSAGPEQASQSCVTFFHTLHPFRTAKSNLHLWHLRTKEERERKRKKERERRTKANGGEGRHVCLRGESV